MVYATAVQRHAFLSDLRLAQEAARASVVPSRAASQDRSWALWTNYCLELCVDPQLSNIDDPVVLLQVFGQRYRSGAIAPSGRPVKSRTVEDAMRAVGQTLARMGTPDPRLEPSGKVTYRLRQQLTGYAKQDPAPKRVKPIPMPVIQRVMHMANISKLIIEEAIADLIVLGFFFLFRPGESTVTSESTCFTLADIHFSVGFRVISAVFASPDDLTICSAVSFTFTNQKNGNRGEIIRLTRSGDPYICPVLAAARRVTHLRLHKCIGTTPICAYYQTARRRNVTPDNMTQTLRHAVAALPHLGILPVDVSARSLRASGAMALLCARVDDLTIRLLGRWNSDAMCRYLHVQAEPVMRGLAALMLKGGIYHLHPGTDVPAHGNTGT